MNTTHNVVSVSGGKDSTAVLALAVIQEVPNLLAVFADTGSAKMPMCAQLRRTRGWRMPPNTVKFVDLYPH